MGFLFELQKNHQPKNKKQKLLYKNKITKKKEEEQKNPENVENVKRCKILQKNYKTNTKIDRNITKILQKHCKR